MVKPVVLQHRRQVTVVEAQKIHSVSDLRLCLPFAAFPFTSLVFDSSYAALQFRDGLGSTDCPQCRRHLLVTEELSQPVNDLIGLADVNCRNLVRIVAEPYEVTNPRQRKSPELIGELRVFENDIGSFPTTGIDPHPVEFARKRISLNQDERTVRISNRSSNFVFCNWLVINNFEINLLVLNPF